MPKWAVTDSQTGAKTVYEGTSPPTEAQLDNLFAEQSLTSGARAASTAPAAAPEPGPSPSPSGPGFMSRLGTAIGMLPPVAAVERGARNIINPLVAAGRFAVNTVEPYMQNVVWPQFAKEAGDVASVVGRGARNIVRPFVPSAPDPSALIGGPEAVQAWGRVFNPPPSLPQDNPPAGPITLPQAPLARAQRETGKVYMTPAGPRRWMGTGWQRLS